MNIFAHIYHFILSYYISNEPFARFLLARIDAKTL